MATTTTSSSTAPAPFKLDAPSRMVFIALLVGMFVAAISQTIVSPALPVIVADLGGMDHYSWLATSAMLATAVFVPIVGKLSDLYGRRPFYIAGLVLFMVGAIAAALAPNFWALVGARVLQGFGMGTLMPLSQVIIGDIIPPRQRGKYQGWMAAVFGVCSIAGPVAGGLITDNFGWRWLFLAAVPFGLLALVFIARYLHLPHTPRKAVVDVWGIVTLTVALVTLLLATSWGGATYAWRSPQVLGFYAVGALALLAFVLIERKAAEPVVPLRLFTAVTFSVANLANFAIAIGMFGAIFYIPVWAQGVMGVDATQSGLVMIPMSVAMIGYSIIVGQLITRTGRYKAFMVTGTLMLLAGFVLLARLGHGSSVTELVVAMIAVGLGLGATLQTYVLVVQNDAGPLDMGIATSVTQFFRSAGATVGVAVLGTVMANRLVTSIDDHLDPAVAASVPPGSITVDAVLDPEALAGLPEAAVSAVRMGLADALHQVFLVAIPVILVAVIATMFVRVMPLRETLHPAEPVDAEAEAEDSTGADARAGESGLAQPRSAVDQASTAVGVGGEPARHG